MRSPPDLRRAAAITAFAAAAAAALPAAGCGHDTVPACDHSFLRYDNFGAPFMLDWCNACHSAALPADMRQQAPAGVDFDTRSEIRRWSFEIERTAGTGASMPPEGGPPEAERQMLVEWLACGAP